MFMCKPQNVRVYRPHFQPHSNSIEESTHLVWEGRPHHITTQGHVATRRPGHESTEDAERDDVGLLDDDVHVLVDDSAVFQVEKSGGVTIDGGSLRLRKSDGMCVSDGEDCVNDRKWLTNR